MNGDPSEIPNWENKLTLRIEDLKISGINVLLMRDDKVRSAELIRLAPMTIVKNLKTEYTHYILNNNYFQSIEMGEEYMKPRSICGELKIDKRRDVELDLYCYDILSQIVREFYNIIHRSVSDPAEYSFTLSNNDEIEDITYMEFKSSKKIQNVNLTNLNINKSLVFQIVIESGILIDCVFTKDVITSGIDINSSKINTYSYEIHIKFPSEKSVPKEFPSLTFRQIVQGYIKKLFLLNPVFFKNSNKNDIGWIDQLPDDPNGYVPLSTMGRIFNIYETHLIKNNIERPKSNDTKEELMKRFKEKSTIVIDTTVKESCGSNIMSFKFKGDTIDSLEVQFGDEVPGILWSPISFKTLDTKVVLELMFYSNIYDALSDLIKIGFEEIRETSINGVPFELIFDPLSSLKQHVNFSDIDCDDLRLIKPLNVFGV